MSKRTISSNIVIAISLTMITLATTNAKEGERKERRGPPPEAIEACSNLSLDDQCQFTTPRGHDLTGICFSPDIETKALACKPDKNMRRNHREEEGEA